FHLLALLLIGTVLIGLPGTWVMLLMAAVLEWSLGGVFGLWTLGIAVLVAGIGEAIEFFAGAAGSKIGGGSNRAAVGAVIGGLVGGIMGAAFPPILGALIWGVIGAGIGAVIAELTVRRADAKPFFRSRMEMTRVARAGGGAAAGRFLGLLGKTACAIIVWLMLLISPFFFEAPSPV
ncbi:MAG: DUF456 domain-containing protein, partial [Planctomycetota bacterium]